MITDRIQHHPECDTVPLDYCICDIVDERNAFAKRIAELTSQRDRARALAVLLEQDHTRLEEEIGEVRSLAAKFTTEIIRITNPPAEGPLLTVIDGEG